MAKIITLPEPERAKCRTCGAVFEYLPEEVDSSNFRDYGHGAESIHEVKCPREGCTGKAWWST